MRYLILLTTIILFASCSREKWCLEHYPQPNSVDSIYIEKVIIDTVHSIIPADTLIIELPFDCPDQDTVIIEASNQSIKYVVKDRKIYIESVCNEDSLKIIIANLEKNLKTSKETTIEVKYVPKWQKILSYIGVLSILLISLYIYIKIKP